MELNELEEKKFVEKIDESEEFINEKLEDMMNEMKMYEEKKEKMRKKKKMKKKMMIVKNYKG